MSALRSFVLTAQAIPVRVLVRYSQDIDIDIDVAEGQDVDVDIQLPKGARDIDIDIELPEGNDIDVDVELPAGKDIDVDVQFPEGHDIDLDVELPAGHDIDLDVELPKGHDFDLDLQVPRGHGIDVDMEFPKKKDVSVDLQIPRVSKDDNSGLTGTEDYDEDENYEDNAYDFDVYDDGYLNDSLKLFHGDKPASMKIPMWEGDACEGLPESTCSSTTGCVWCTSAAIPSSCFTEVQYNAHLNYWNASLSFFRSLLFRSLHADVLNYNGDLNKSLVIFV